MAEQVPRIPKEPANGTGSPLHQKPAGHAASTAVVVENRLYPGPCGAGHHMTHPAPGVRSYLPHHGHRIRKCQRGLSLRKRPPGMLWRSPSPRHCHGKIRCERRKISKRGTPLLEEIPSPVHPPHVWRAVASVTFQWLKKALSNAIPTLWWRKK